MKDQFTIDWLDGGREPRCRPDPDYPTGKDVDLSSPEVDSCCTPLPYPARRCGVFAVTCQKCDMRVAVTTAGRPDDPRSLTMPCKARREMTG